MMSVIKYYSQTFFFSRLSKLVNEHFFLIIFYVAISLSLLTRFLLQKFGSNIEGTRIELNFFFNKVLCIL